MAARRGSIRSPAVVVAATAFLLLSACGDDGPSTLAKGEDIELVGDEHLGGRTLNIDAEEEDGVVTGEFWLDDNVITIECADTATDGVVILGGEGTGPEISAELGTDGLLLLIIREGDPDSVSFGNNPLGAGSCTELVESVPDDVLTDDAEFVDVEAGYDIETG